MKAIAVDDLQRFSAADLKAIVVDHFKGFSAADLKAIAVDDLQRVFSSRFEGHSC